jgi:hypothetical protein
MDCIGRLARRASDREIASQLDRFWDQMDLIASKGLPALCKAAVIASDYNFPKLVCVSISRSLLRRAWRDFGVALMHALYECLFQAWPQNSNRLG